MSSFNPIGKHREQRAHHDRKTGVQTGRQRHWVIDPKNVSAQHVADVRAQKHVEVIVDDAPTDVRPLMKYDGQRGSTIAGRKFPQLRLAELWIRETWFRGADIRGGQPLPPEAQAVARELFAQAYPWRSDIPEQFVYAKVGGNSSASNEDKWTIGYRGSNGEVFKLSIDDALRGEVWNDKKIEDSCRGAISPQKDAYRDAYLAVSNVCEDCGQPFTSTTGGAVQVDHTAAKFRDIESAWFTEQRRNPLGVDTTKKWPNFAVKKKETVYDTARSTFVLKGEPLASFSASHARAIRWPDGFDVPTRESPAVTSPALADFKTAGTRFRLICRSCHEHATEGERAERWLDAHTPAETRALVASKAGFKRSDRAWLDELWPGWEDFAEQPGDSVPVSVREALLSRPKATEWDDIAGVLGEDWDAFAEVFFAA